MKHVVITIGREYGSGGRLIAKKLSEELGITFYDKEFIAAVAKKTGFSENFIRDTEHQRPTNSFLYDLYTAVQTPSVPDQVFVAQAKVIKELAAKESCVIVGRCADYILRDRGCTLDVFICAPLEARKKRVSERLGISPEKAEELISRTDRKRETYYNYFTFGNWGMASNYDLCIDSSILDISGTADYIIDFADRAGMLG